MSISLLSVFMMRDSILNEHWRWEMLVTLLITAVLLWSALHLFPSLMPGTREVLMKRLGTGPYRGLFALSILASIVLMGFGWNSAIIEPVYVPPLYGSPIITGIMLLSFVLFAAAHAPGNIKRFLRHPMLSGVALWSCAHLLANGDNRSVVLFGGLGLWAIIAMLTINIRDGARETPAAVAFSKDLMTIVAAGIIFAIVIYFHAAVIGVSPLPGL